MKRQYQIDAVYPPRDNDKHEGAVSFAFRASGMDELAVTSDWKDKKDEWQSVTVATITGDCLVRVKSGKLRKRKDGGVYVSVQGLRIPREIGDAVATEAMARLDGTTSGTTIGNAGGGADCDENGVPY